MTQACEAAQVSYYALMSRKPARAKMGSIDGALLVRLPNSLRKQIDRAAKAAGLSSAEWVRRAAQKVLADPP